MPARIAVPKGSGARVTECAGPNPVTGSAANMSADSLHNTNRRSPSRLLPSPSPSPLQEQEGSGTARGSPWDGRGSGGRARAGPTIAGQHAGPRRRCDPDLHGGRHTYPRFVQDATPTRWISARSGQGDGDRGNDHGTAYRRGRLPRTRG